MVSGLLFQGSLGAGVSSRFRNDVGKLFIQYENHKLSSTVDCQCQLDITESTEKTTSVDLEKFKGTHVS